MVVGVPGALLGAGRAYPDAGSQQMVDREVVPLGAGRERNRAVVSHRSAQFRQSAMQVRISATSGSTRSASASETQACEQSRHASIAAATSAMSNGTSIGEASNISRVVVMLLPPRWRVGRARITLSHTPRQRTPSERWVWPDPSRRARAASRAGTPPRRRPREGGRTGSPARCRSSPPATG
jgi:hypothetical protein